MPKPVFVGTLVGMHEFVVVSNCFDRFVSILVSYGTSIAKDGAIGVVAGAQIHLQNLSAASANVHI